MTNTQPNQSAKEVDSRYTVRYIDADAASCAAVRDRLGQSLPDVRVMASESATALDGTAAPDCVVSRYALSETDGVELLERIRDQWPSVPFILFAAAGSEAVAERAIAAGVTAYVRDTGADAYDRLIDAINTALEAGGHRPANETGTQQTDVKRGHLRTATETGTQQSGGERGRQRTAVETIDKTVEETVIHYDPGQDSPDTIRAAVCDHWQQLHGETCTFRFGELRSPSEPTQSVKEWIDRARSEGTQRFTWPCTTAEGREFWAEVTLNPIPQSDHLVVVIRDVTAHEQREQRLQAFQRAVEHAGHSMYITDTDGEIEYVNAAFEEKTGYSEREAVGQTPALLKSGEHDESFYAGLWSTILDGETWKDEIINERKDGSRYVANQTIAPITDETGTPVRFVAVNADITEQKRREQQLQALYEATAGWLTADTPEAVCAKASEHLASLLEFDQHGIHLYDEDTECLEAVAVSTGNAVTLDDIPAFEKGEGIAWTVYETGEPRRYDDVRTDPEVYDEDTDARSELIIPLGDHGVLLVSSAQSCAFTDADETIVKVFASMLTEVLTRIDRERKLEQQNSRLEEFANLVSHDLRNPLSVAKTHLELASNSGDLGHLEDIQSAHNRMERIIDDLLWLAREGQAIGQTETVDLPTLIERAWNNVNTPEATLSVTCEGEITADKNRLQQLFENLFRNAVEHAGPDVAIRVGALDDGLYVEDDGSGIPEDEHERVLDPGYSTAEESTGYGLAIVNRIVDAHGWSLSIMDGADGGARFEIRGVEEADAGTPTWCP